MRVAVIKSSGNIDNRIERILMCNEINGDFIDKFTMSSIKKYDTIIFTCENKISNLPKIIEQIVLEEKYSIIFINNKLSVGQFYNVLNNMYFNIVNDHSLDIELISVLNLSDKYLKEISSIKSEIFRLKERIHIENLMNNAKRILSIKGYNEADSHQFIQKKAMDLRLSKKMTAELIIKNKIDF